MRKRGVGDSFVLYFVSRLSALKTGVLTFFNSMWTRAVHLGVAFRGGKKLANMLEI